MSANDKAASAWDDYINQQQEEKIEELKRELNAANSRIELLMSANADVARIAGERDAAEKRIRLLIAKLDKYQDRIQRLEEFVDQLTNPKFTRDDLPKEALLQRIKRLEDAGDNMAEWLEDMRNLGADACLSHAWREAKEAKP